jgi:hypothetical protein
MDTILLGANTWDLLLDAAGNIAAASEPYSLAQDAASACRTFSDIRSNGSGECWYNTTLGVGYKAMLGKAPNVPLIKAKMVSQALLVPGVVSAKVFITGIADRRVTGQIQVTDKNGNVTAAAI